MDDSTLLSTPSIRLKILRKVLSLKQLTLAELINVSISTIGNWERSEVYLHPSHKERLRYVGINTQWIEYGTGEPFSLDLEKVKHNIFFTLKRG